MAGKGERKGREGRGEKGEGRGGKGEGREMDPRNFENRSTPMHLMQLRHDSHTSNLDSHRFHE